MIKNYKKSKASDPGVDIKSKNTLDKSQNAADG